MKKLTKTQQIINHIKAAGKNGLLYGEIQKFIVENFYGFNYDEKDFTGKRRLYRGYWGSSLNSNKHKPGILNKNCEKIGKKYVHKDFIAI